MSLRARLGVALHAFIVVVTLFLTASRPALAWVDVNVEADDVHILVNKGGDARIEHKITLKVAGGPLRAFDIRGVDADATPDADGYVVGQREAAKGSLASAQAVVAERMPPDAKPHADDEPAPTVLRVHFDPDKGLGRGVYVLLVRYATHLGSRINNEGALTRVTWRGPLWNDGFDSARATFDLPTAPTEPRAEDGGAAQAGGGRPPLVLTTVRRGIARDQIELIRPYAPKGEAIPWVIRVDTRALAGASRSASSEPSGVGVAVNGPLGRGAQRVLLVSGALSLFLFYASLVALKSVEVTYLTRAAGATTRPLVPLPTAVRAILASAFLVGGVFLELVLMRATLGALLVVVAVLFASHAPPRWQRRALRGPGVWLPIAEAIAFRTPPRARGAYLDVSTWAGKVILMVCLAVVLGGAAILYDTSAFRGQLVAFDAVALLAVFCTGRMNELPPHPATAPAHLLGRVARQLRKAWPTGELRIIGRIRVPNDNTEPDELRLVALPKIAPAGFLALEVGVVHVPGAGGTLALPQVLLRVVGGSACDRALSVLARHGRTARGRKAGERAILFTPRLPTMKMTADLVQALVRALTIARPALNPVAPVSRRAA